MKRSALFSVIFSSLLFFFFVSRVFAQLPQCLTRQQITDDPRCLFIINNKVYEKGSRNSPHQGHPCGSDVTSIIPQFHTLDPVRYLSPNYRMDVCLLVPPTPIPTATPRPTAVPTQGVPTPTRPPSSTPTTPATGQTMLNFTLKLHGIGNGGDNPNPNSKGNFNPINYRRDLTVQVLGVGDALVKQSQIPINFSPTTGLYTGSANLGTPFLSGAYTIKLMTKLYLHKRLPNIVVINQGQTTNVPVTALVVGDSNGDNTLSVVDYNLILDCYSDLVLPKACDGNKKGQTDLDDDTKVNQNDYNLFLRELSVQSGQ